MGKAKHRTYPEEKHNDKERALRKKIKDQEKEILRLKSELKTLNKAFEKTAGYIKGNTDNYDVETVIDNVKKEQTLQQLVDNNKCPQCGGDIKISRLPFGKIMLCIESCGYRDVVKYEDN